MGGLPGNIFASDTKLAEDQLAANRRSPCVGCVAANHPRSGRNWRVLSMSARCQKQTSTAWSKNGFATCRPQTRSCPGGQNKLPGEIRFKLVPGRGGPFQSLAPRDMLQPAWGRP